MELFTFLKMGASLDRITIVPLAASGDGDALQSDNAALTLQSVCALWRLCLLPFSAFAFCAYTPHPLKQTCAAHAHWLRLDPDVYVLGASLQEGQK